MPRTLRINTLGSLSISLDGEPVTGLASRKVEAILVYLACTGRVHPREVLGEFFWEERTQERAMGNLRVALASLRKELGEYVEITRDTAAINPEADIWLDVHELESKLDGGLVANAVELYQGPFLEGFFLREAREFEDWLYQERKRIERRVLEGFNDLVGFDLERGAFRSGIRNASRLLAMDPLNENAHRQMMLLLVCSGQRSAALTQYETCRQVLDSELGVEPSDEIQEVYDSLVAGERPPGIPEVPGVEPRARVLVGECPYRGLAAFREQDAPFFFGREAFTENLFQAVTSRLLVAVIVGSSGSGKSSTVFAGLLPRLRQEDGWKIIKLRPGREPFQSLSAALLPMLEPGLSDSECLLESGKMASALGEMELPLFNVVERVLASDSDSKRLLLVVDQFEELYTLCPDPNMRRRYLDALLEAVETTNANRVSPFVLLLTMRADFMGQALAYRPFADALQDASLILGPMNETELRVAIEKPAELKGAAFEAGLVERLLDDVGQEPGNLPLLEFALTLLWEKQNYGWMTHAGYEEIGRVEGALASYADQVFEELDENEQEVAHRIFVQLVRPGVGTEDTRRMGTKQEVGEGNWELVQHLADKRLVVTGSDPGGVETVEVGHEALIQRWNTLRSWIESDREFRTWQERLRGAMAAWEESGRDQGALLRGVPLAEAVGWEEERGEEISGAESEFIAASSVFQAQRQIERDRRRRRIMVGLAGGLVVALALAAIAWLNWQRVDTASELASERQATAQSASSEAQREADVSRSLVLAANARDEYEAGHTDLALHLALEAVSIDDPPDEAERALSDLAYSAGSVALFEWYDEGEWSTAVAFSPDGRYVASVSNLGGLLLWDLEKELELWRIQAHDLTPWDDIAREYMDGVKTVGFTPDGEMLVTGSIELGYDLLAESVRFWDVRTGQMIMELLGYNDTLGISPDGRYFAAAEVVDEGGSDIVIWDVETGQEVRRLTGADAQVTSAAFSPDGKTIVSGERSPMLRLWEFETGEQIKQMEVEGYGGLVQDVSFSPDGSSIYEVNGFDWRMWDVASGQQLRRDEYYSTVVGLSHSSSGNFSAFTNWMSSRWFLWDIEQWRPIQLFDNPIADNLPSDTAFSPDSRTVLVSYTDGSACLWDLTPPELVRQWTDLDPWCGALGLSPDGSQLITGNSEGETVLWDLKSGEQLMQISDVPGTVTDMDFSPDGKYAGIVIADFFGGTRSNALVIWDLINDTEYMRLDESLHLFEPDPESEEGNYYVYRLKFSPDGSTILTGSMLSNECCEPHGNLILWDAGTGEVVHILDHDGDYQVMEYTSDSQRAVVLDGFQPNPNVKVWDLQTGEMLSAFIDSEHSDDVFAMALHPDEQRLITAAVNGTMYMRNLETGEIIHSFVGHRGGIADVDISPDGTRAISSSFEGEVLLWDVETGELLRQFTEHQATVWDVDFSPDGQTAFSTSVDGRIIQWRVAPQSREEVIEWMKNNRVYRDLTPEECEQFGLPPASGVNVIEGS